jgi:hypothetical protein
LSFGGNLISRYFPKLIFDVFSWEKFSAYRIIGRLTTVPSVGDLSDRSRRLFELAERVVGRLDANPGEYSVKEIESLIEKICHTTKRIPSEKTRQNQAQPRV